MSLRLSSTNWTGNRFFGMGFGFHSGPATNKAVEGYRQDIIPVDITIGPNTTILMDVSTLAGAIQTGTHDLNVDFVYDDGNTPQDVLDQYKWVSGMLPVKGGVFGRLAALATTSETPMDNNNSAEFNIPASSVAVTAVSII